MAHPRPHIQLASLDRFNGNDIHLILGCDCRTKHRFIVRSMDARDVVESSIWMSISLISLAHQTRSNCRFSIRVVCTRQRTFHSGNITQKEKKIRNAYAFNANQSRFDLFPFPFPFPLFYLRFAFGTAWRGQLEHLRYICVDQKKCILLHGRLTHKNQINFCDRIEFALNTSALAAAQAGAGLIFKNIFIVLSEMFEIEIR